MPALIDVSHISRRYPVRSGRWKRARQLHALRDVSFGVEEGTTFGLVGESGSGKSTTAKLILGVESPDEGQVRIAGRQVESGRRRSALWLRRLMQPVLQDPYSSLNPRMSVGEIVAEPLQIQRPELARQEVRKRVAAALDQVGLQKDSIDRTPGAFSGGQRQRIAIARALAVEARILVLDEPVSALDVSIQAQVINLLSDLQQQAKLTYILISHDLAVVSHLSTRVGVLYLGKLVEIGSRNELLRHARHPYTQALIAAAEPASGDFSQILSGEIPSPLDLPLGCPFSSRCPGVEARCREVEPALRRIAEDHHVACHLV